MCNHCGSLICSSPLGLSVTQAFGLLRINGGRLRIKASQLPLLRAQGRGVLLFLLLLLHLVSHFSVWQARGRATDSY